MDAPARASDRPVRAPGQGVTAGLVALAAGLGAGHAASALVGAGSSPLFAVANRVVDATPTPVKEWAVRSLGSGDKAVLILVLLAVASGLAVALGRLASRSLGLGLAGVAAVAAVCAGAAVGDPSATWAWVAPSVAAGLVGAFFLATMTPASSRGAAATPSGPAWSRRRVLTTAAGAGVAVAGFAAGEAVPANLGDDVVPVLPEPAVRLPAAPVGLEARGLTPLITPTADFYRVDTALSVPRLSYASWRLIVDGDVERPLTLGWDDLAAYEVVERDVTMICVSNPIGGPYAGTARWLGVRTRDVLAAAGPRATADMVLSESVDGFTISTPLAALTDGRDALLAFGMNGVPLPRDHGAPVRLVTPGLYGYVGSTKWVTRLTVTRFGAQSAYWTLRGWAERAPIKAGSRIDVPRADARLTAGPLVVAGVAWAQRIGVAEVQLRFDEGPWLPTTVGPDAGVDAWRQWVFAWDAVPGRYFLEVRVVDAAGSEQTDRPADPFPDGASGYHGIAVTVR